MSNEENQQRDKMLQKEISPEVAQGTYANLAMIAHSTSEVIIDFVCMMPGLPKANVKSRIVMAPEHAKRLLYALQDNISKYEHTFGEIDLHNGGPRTAAPFKINKGEA
ncbi:MAG: DUF3467 domain-containing protein [Paraprevotella sp.]|nr:DUF3467 domain-containing protein [Paraprevotella sp.]